MKRTLKVTNLKENEHMVFVKECLQGRKVDIVQQKIKRKKIALCVIRFENNSK